MKRYDAFKDWKSDQRNLNILLFRAFSYFLDYFTRSQIIFYKRWFEAKRRKIQAFLACVRILICISITLLYHSLRYIHEIFILLQTKAFCYVKFSLFTFVSFFFFFFNYYFFKWKITHEKSLTRFFRIEYFDKMVQLFYRFDGSWSVLIIHKSTIY